MAECCSQSCTKARAVFTLGLLECFFFSGFLTGYGFIARTLEDDGYFLPDAVGVVVGDDGCAPRLVPCPTNLTSGGLLSPTAALGSTPPVGTIPPPPGGAPSLKVHPGITVVRGSVLNYTLDTDDGGRSGEPPSVGITTPGQVGPTGDCPDNYNFTGGGAKWDVNASWRAGSALACVTQQRRSLHWVQLVSLLVTGLLAAPLGLLYDVVGTLKTRILPIILFTTSTLLVTFSSKESAWLVFVAMPTAGVSGVLLVLTNLQVANLLHHRVTALLLYHLAADGAAVIMMLVQLSARAGLNIQSSFMFLTGGVIPLLVCTIAFLPKRQIPWPLPDNYKEMKDSIRMYVHKNCQAQIRKKASHRRLLRLSVATGGLSCLYLVHVTWFIAMMLRIRAVEFRHQSWCETVGDVTSNCVLPEPRCVYNATYPCATLLILLIGLGLDRRLREHIEGDEKKQRLIIWCHAVIFLVLTLLNVAMSALVLTSPPWAGYVIASAHVVLRVAVPGMSASFIFTVLPCRHFGQNYGTSLAAVALLQALVLYPLDILINQSNAFLTVEISGLCLTALCLLYPFYLLASRETIEFTVKAKEQDIMLCPAGSMCKSDRSKGKGMSGEECQTMVESMF